MRISVISIGTELTVGQIINRNAAWIANQVKSFGFECSFHLTVPDNRELILEALNLASQHSDVLFITGGLGPTSDDFTRNVFAEWTEQELVWNEAAWQHVHDRLSPRGIAVKEIQRQQCYFPKTAKILKNRVGTANGFLSKHKNIDCFILPGPPRELEAIWQDEIQAWVAAKADPQKSVITKSWDTMGVGESDVAEMVIAAIGSCKFELGYRVHLPYVEVKLSYSGVEATEAEVVAKKIDLALAKITVLRDGADAAEILSQKLSNYEHAYITDLIPGSFLLQRLFPFSKQLLHLQKMSFTSNAESFGNKKQNCVYLQLSESNLSEKYTAEVNFEFNGKRLTKTIQSPYKSPLLREREQQYFAEMAMLAWIELD